jgi:hypothetical protein
MLLIGFEIPYDGVRVPERARDDGESQNEENDFQLA